MEPSEGNTLLDSAIPAEQTKYLPDVQKLNTDPAEPEPSLAHINPFWYSNPSEPIRQPEQTSPSEATRLSGPLAVFEQPTFPEAVNSSDHESHQNPVNPKEPPVALHNATLPELAKDSRQDGDLAQGDGKGHPNSYQSAVLSQGNHDIEATNLAGQETPSAHGSATKVQKSTSVNSQEQVQAVEPKGALEHTDPTHIISTSDEVHYEDHMDMSEDNRPEAQEEFREQANPADGQISLGRTLDVDSSDADSALGSDTSSLTTSISSSVTDYRFEHGRRYHAFHDGAYYLPNDEIETDRLDLQHHVWRMTLNNALYLSPISDNISTVLDVGTGTGIWAIEYAQEHPSVQVIGVDLSPIQPAFVPPNCSFIIDNVEEDWVYDKKFDFIHSRMLVLGIHDWSRFFRQSWDYMKPGGWLEMQELQLPCQCDDGSATRESPFIDWSHKLMEAATNVSIDTLACEKFEDQLTRQGFINIKHESIKWPIGPWAKGKKEKELGMWMLENTLQGLQGLSMALLTRHLGWSPEAVELFLVGVRKQMFDRSSHVYVVVKVIIAQKPYDA